MSGYSYDGALKAAGAEVHTFESFGTYQGDWWAKVTYKGKTGWVHGWFGSCSGCDAFEAEFGWDDPTNEQLATFGVQYLDELWTQEEAEKDASEDLSWDMDAKDMLEFIKQNKIN
jgi:hypothetical protein